MNGAQYVSYVKVVREQPVVMCIFVCIEKHGTDVMMASLLRHRQWIKDVFHRSEVTFDHSV